MSVAEQTIIYPQIRRDETVIDDYHGTKIPDPYCWLEDPDSEETKSFVEAQNSLTLPYLKECSANQKFYNRMKELWDYPKYGCPFKRGSRYFYFYNSGLQNQSVLYVQESIEAEAEVFFDPNKLSEDGTVSIRGYEFSEDGEIFAVALSESGSDWIKVKFMKVATKETLEDVLKRVKFTCLSWTHDHKGLFYNRFPEEDGKQDGTETSINLNQKLYYHVIGTSQSEDILCAEFPEQPKWMSGAELSDDGRYVLLSIREGCDPVNRLYYVDLENLDNKISGLLPFVKVVDNFDAEYEYIANEGTLFTFKTNFKSPKYRVINIDFQKPEPNVYGDIDEESSDEEEDLGR